MLPLIVEKYIANFRYEKSVVVLIMNQVLDFE